MFSGRAAPFPVQNSYSLAVAGSVHHKNSLFSVGRPTNMHFPSSEADEKGDRSASRMGKARFPGFLGSEADGKGSW